MVRMAPNRRTSGAEASAGRCTRQRQQRCDLSSWMAAFRALTESSSFVHKQRLAEAVTRMQQKRATGSSHDPTQQERTAHLRSRPARWRPTAPCRAAAARPGSRRSGPEHRSEHIETHGASESEFMRGNRERCVQSTTEQAIATIVQQQTDSESASNEDGGQLTCERVSSQPAT